MVGAQNAPQQHGQASRKGKKAWRKNIDISDVQDGLEQLRDEIITGGPIAERPSEDIFAIDTLGSEAVRERHHKTHKQLRAEEILAQRSVVPAVDSRKRSSSKVTDGIIGPSSKRQKKDWVSSQELRRLKDSLDENSHLSSKQLQNDEEVDFDLWSRNDIPQEDVKYEYLERAKPKIAPPTISHAPIAMTANGKAVKAVKTPKAGTSYNPSFTDWDDLLNQEGQKVVDAEKKRLQAEQLEAERAARIATISSEHASNARTEDESGWEGFESEYEVSERLKKKRPERKTRAQRNKIKRRKVAEGQALHQARMVDQKKQRRDLEELARRNRAVVPHVGDNLAMVEDEVVSSEDGDDSVLRRKRLRNMPIPEKRLEVVLPDELQECLRRLKPEGNLLDDRFRNLLVNGKVEARKPILQPKKKRVTYTEKWTYKDFQILA